MLFPIIFITNLIETFCIVNDVKRLGLPYTMADLIETFCIVNEIKKTLGWILPEFNRNILYCKLEMWKTLLCT